MGDGSRGDLPAVHFRGIVLGPSGFAAEGREWLWALEAAGLAPSLEGAALGDLHADLTPDEDALIARCAARPVRPGGITFHHLLIPHFAPDPTAAQNWLCTVFETDGLPAGWAEQASGADRVLLKTEWARDVFARAGVPVEAIIVLPPPFDPQGFEPIRNRTAEPGAPFRWLSVFDWTLRKGWDALLPAFAKTFGADEAELILKINPRADLSTDRIRAHCQAAMQHYAPGAPPRVVVHDDIVGRDELAGLYASADGFVLPSRGEGWGRPVHEAMLMELPVVATGQSALQTLVPDSRAGYPVLARKQLVPRDAAAETPWFRGQVWYEPDPDDLAHRMREVYDNRAAAELRGRTGRLHVLELCDRVEIASALQRLAADAARVLQHQP